MKKILLMALIVLTFCVTMIPAPSLAKTAYPTYITLDNADKQHQYTGKWQTVQNEKSFYRFDHLIHKGNAQKATAQFKWKFDLPENGKYRIYVRYSSEKDRATNAPYYIYANNGMITKHVNQQNKGNSWVDIGSFEFKQGLNTIVQTNQANGSVSVDALRLEQLNPSTHQEDEHHYEQYMMENQKNKVKQAPKNDVVQPVHYNGPRTAKKVALTFDDGPHAEYTGRILDILKTEDIPATFFILGEKAESYPDLVKRIYNEGHTVASHTWDHPQLTNLTTDQIRQQLTHTNIKIESLIGKKAKLLRPPYGAVSGIEDTIEQQGYELINWDVDTEDWRSGRTVQNIMDSVKDQSQSGSIILQHDGGGNREATVQALPEIISYLENEGYELVTIDELLNLPAYEQPNPDVVTVDNAAPTNQFQGIWNLSHSVSGYYGVNYQPNAAGSGSDTFTWNFNVPTDGTYRVKVFYTSGSDRATNAPYTIYANGSTTTKTVNQQINGQSWVDIGSYNFKSGTNKIVLSDLANGYVIADAIQIEKIKETTPEVITLDNTDSSHSKIGTWPLSTNVAGYYGSNYQPNASGSGADTFTWNFNIPAEGRYKVSVYYPAAPDRATNAPYTVHSNGSTTTKFVNQQTKGSTWVDIGSYHFKNGTNKIVQSDLANGYVIADAIRIEKVKDFPKVITLDNMDPTHSTKGNWGLSTNVAGYYGINYQPNAKGSGADTFTWNFNIPEEGRYKVSVYYPAASDRATNAPYTVYANSSTTTKTVNQQVNGQTWVDIGSYNFKSGTNKIVQSDLANGYVIADAIRIEYQSE
ncbi:polysaccharide deacetylase family protein [Hazenella sp. IB182353]|uniref:golvesin C-terminal-like domain-containing protein n=1 Tax=Polycladospora coralii TaxID=2771432 RepID=UPI001746B25E|nr:polysaccharide deacetylase family protein [Polycladospora coralii]MBS7530884.1 polysaccharide deacetylase family protein [Polycladospora coralii]